MTESIKCPSCGADIEIKDGKNIAFCPYCGSKIIFDDGVDRTEHIERNVDEAKIKEIEYKTKKLEFIERENDKDRKIGWVEICITIIIIAWVIKMFIG